MRPLFACLCACLLATLSAPAQTPSPFQTPGGGPAVPGDSSQPFEFTGVVATHARTLICVTTTAERRSRWIEVGNRLEGIKVVNYDATAQRVVIEAGGRSHTLALKRPAPRPQIAGAPAPLPPPAPATAMPLPAPAPAAGVAQAVPVTNEEKEREARMLVSDLLEIGMIQRKAYEEAQKKEAAEAGAKKADPTSGNAPEPRPE